MKVRVDQREHGLRVQADDAEGMVEACKEGWTMKNWNRTAFRQLFRDVNEPCTKGCLKQAQMSEWSENAIHKSGTTQHEPGFVE